ncbi:Secretion protein HlyD [Candidatus Magnetoovum chiemensis]|nr:Secretion protein HlyD [Candidatus Magnetoovum chiemensis]
MFKKWQVLLIICAVIVVLLLYLKLNEKTITVKAQIIKENDLIITVSATSICTIKSEKTFYVSSKRFGKVEKVLFNEGDIVQKDEILALLDNKEAQLKITKAQAALDKFIFKLEELKKSYTPYKENITSEIKKTEAVFEEKKTKSARYKDIHKKGYISDDLYDQVNREYEVANSSYKKAVSAKKTLDAKQYAILSQEKAVDEAKTALELAYLEYEYTIIKAQADGVISLRDVEPGESVLQGRKLFEIVQNDKFYVEAFIDEVDAGKVKIGAEVNITIDAYPNSIFKGEVYIVSPVVLGSRLEARTFEARIKFTDPPKNLKHGMSADIEIIADKIENTISVPSYAVFERDTESYIYKINNNSAKLIKIKTGMSSWTETEIKEGLKNGDTIITTPDANGLTDGSKIKIDKEL